MVRSLLSLPVHYRSAAWAALILAAVPNTAAGQIEFGTYGGIFAPTGDIAEWTVVGPFLPDTATRRLHHRTSLTVGGRLTVWLSRWVGIEAGLAYAPTSLELAATSTRFPGEHKRLYDAVLLAATGRALLRFPLPSDIATAHVTGGLGVLNHAGDGYDELDGTTDVVTVIGTGLRVVVSERLAIRLDIEDYLSSPDLSLPEGDAEVQNKFQHDLVVSSSLAVSLSRE